VYVNVWRATISSGAVRRRAAIFGIAAVGALTFVMQAGVGSDAPASEAPNADRPALLAAGGAEGAASAESAEIRWFNDRPVRPVRTLRMKVTAYSPDARSCGRFADGITASGYSVYTNGMKLVAADTDLLPLGTLLSVPGYDAGAIVPVLDRGGKIKGSRLDVLFPTHRLARKWGVRDLTVTVWEYADGEPCDFEMRW
jgi:3D (Asp-Asp-Asp) domain-containing protein